MIVETTAIWPDYLAFFNIAAGGPKNGYRHLVDSSLDWGQDLKRLGIWIESRAEKNPKPIYLSYFGSASIKYYNIPAQIIKLKKNPTPLKPGKYCISATNLQQVYLNSSNWTIENENEYWSILSTIRSDENRKKLLATPIVNKNDREMEEKLADLRFARLCAYLRTKNPNHTIGYSILIYDLNAQQFNDAVYGSFMDL